MTRLSISVLMVALAGCRPASQATDRPTSGAGDATLVDARRPGEVLEATIPLIGGGSVGLERFRGRVVILELSASYREEWRPAHQLYRSMLEQHGEDALSVIAVSMDMDPQAIQRHWDRDPPPFVLGWDPQGALAARLRVRRLPTVFVLDAKGRVVHLGEGFSVEAAHELEERVATLFGHGHPGG